MSLLSSPTAETTCRILAVVIGQTVSHYRILEKLGEGGMGVVYKAEDTKLDRAVALKFLPAHLLGNEDVRKRFDREAKSSAALSHPNVCTVHEIDEADGQTFIAMELVEGESLDKKIAQGPQKLDEALSIAQQVAKGLEAAHKRGIVHRDIKPENIMVGEDGHVTIMDFGLAQLIEASRLTNPDETVGTIAYMSPEQAEGSETDQRTDIWSLGVVLYEMVTGRQPFKGDYCQAVIYSVLNEHPEPTTALRAGVPMELEVLVNKCLAKNAEDRYSSNTDLGTDLRACAKLLDHDEATIPRSNTLPSFNLDRDQIVSKSTRSRLRERLVWAMSLAAALVAIALLVWRLPIQDPNSTLARFSWSIDEVVTDAVVSPDGRHIAYLSDSAAGKSIWVQDLDRDEPHRVRDSLLRAPTNLSWSPDSTLILYDSAASLIGVPREGGPSQIMMNSSLGSLRGHTWSPNGETIVFSAVDDGLRRLYVVSSRGGSSRVLFEPSPDQRERRYSFPYFLPVKTGERLLYEVSDISETGRGPYQIAARDLVTGREETLADGRWPSYSPSGHALYQSETDGIWALPFSPETLKSSGEAFPLRENAARPSVSRGGSLVYLSDQPSVPRNSSGWTRKGGRWRVLVSRNDPCSTRPCHPTRVKSRSRRTKVEMPNCGFTKWTDL